MKRSKNIFAAVLAAVVVSVLAAGCGAFESESRKAINDANLASVRRYTEETFPRMMTAFSAEDFRGMLEDGRMLVSMPFSNDLLERWSLFEDAHGRVTGAEVQDAENTVSGFTDRIVLAGADGGKMLLSVGYDKAMKPVSTSIAEYSEESPGGMALPVPVIAAAVSVAALAAVFAFLWRKKAAKKKEEKDRELIAVLTAAVAAYEGGKRPAEGYVVRSVRRLRGGRWR